MVRRMLGMVAAVAAAVGLVAGAAPAGACGGLVAPNGAVRLLRTTTLAAYHDGVEHYVTSFRFAGSQDGQAVPGGDDVGSIIPLPAVPTNVERGGDWTLQRLQRETAPPSRALAGAEFAAAPAAAEVLLQTRIDALDLTVLRGGGAAVAEWARQHHFALTPDTAPVLDFYARRSPVFLAARFDAGAARARGQQVGDGTPVHLTIPVPNPWVPLRILTLGRGALEPVQADVYLLTDHRPALAPVDAPGMTLERSQPASASLLGDLRSDKGMGWVPGQQWLSYLRIDTTSANLDHDLAIDASGAGHPSAVLVGAPVTAHRSPASPPWVALGMASAAALALALALVVGLARRRPTGA